MSLIRRAYLPVLRSVRRTCNHDSESERQFVGAIRTAIADMLKNGYTEAAIVGELNETQKMLKLNIAQVAYNPTIDSYSVKLTDEMVPSNGSVVDIKTPGDLLTEQTKGLDDVIGTYSNR